MMTHLHSRQVRYLPQVLVRMRMGGLSNRSLSHMPRKSWEDFQALRANQVGGLGALACKVLSKVPQLVLRQNTMKLHHHGSSSVS
jgi:glycosyltransferase